MLFHAKSAIHLQDTVLQAPPGYVTPSWPGLYTPTLSVRRSNGNGTDVLPGNYLFEAEGVFAAAGLACDQRLILLCLRYLALYAVLAPCVPRIDLRLSSAMVYPGSTILTDFVTVNAGQITKKNP